MSDVVKTENPLFKGRNPIETLSLGDNMMTRSRSTSMVDSARGPSSPMENRRKKGLAAKRKNSGKPKEEHSDTALSIKSRRAALERSKSSLVLNAPSGDEDDPDEIQRQVNECFEDFTSLCEKGSPASKKASLLTMKNKWSRSFSKLTNKGTGKTPEAFLAELTMDIQPQTAKLFQATSNLVNILEEFVQQSYGAFVKQNDHQSQLLTRLYSMLKKGIEIVQQNSSHNKFDFLFDRALEEIEGAPLQGAPEQVTADSLAIERKSVISSVMRVLKRHIYQEILTIRSFAIQFIGCMSAIDLSLYSALSRSLITKITSILNNTATYLLISKQRESASNVSSVNIQPIDIQKSDCQESIWSPLPTDIPKGAGNLNSLVLLLTSTTSYDNNFTKSFIMTYQAFTTPWALFNKLKERYEVPEDLPDANQIKLRVCIVLKYWIDTRVFDFDEQLLQELRRFISSIDTAQSDVKGRLESTLDSKLEAYMQTLQMTTLERFPTHLFQVYFDKHPTQTMLFLELSEVTVAQQLTLMDCDALQRVEVVGFLNLAWDKPNLKYRALSLIYFIARLNAYSFWVATMILMQSTKAKRVEITKKILDIANELYKLNNFHAVAGITVGLNMASISRLKHTWNDIGKKRRAYMTTFNDLMNPASSYGNYRATLRCRTLPVVPFLGVYLSDLTFIHEGNPDYVDDYINFEKHDLVYNALREVILYQQSRYDFSSNLLLQFFIDALPIWDEKLMYDISLLLEPRGADVSEIV